MPDTAFDNESRTKNRGFETSDVNAPGLFLFVICFAVTLALMAVWLWWLLGSMDRAAIGSEAAPPTAIPVVVHPQPALQPSPGHEHSGQQDLAAMRQNAQHALTTYGWVDRAGNVGRIPIDRAMDILLQRGLPVAKQPAAATTQGGAS